MDEQSAVSIAQILTRIECMENQMGYMSSLMRDALPGKARHPWFEHPADDASECDTYITGHAYGGVAILTRTDVRNARIVKTDSKRLCAVNFVVNNASVLIVNVYMPVEPQIARASSDSTSTLCDEDDSFEVVINEIEMLIECTVCDHVVICGDFNAAFERNNVQSNRLVEFIVRNDLCIGWDFPNTEVVPTYVNTSLNHASRIDHFLVDRCMFDFIQCHEVSADPLNFSSHALLVLTVNIPHNESKVTWVKATCAEKAAYRQQVTALVECLPVDIDAVNCVDMQCVSEAHRNSVNDLCNNLIQCCLLAEQGSIVQPRVARRPIPGKSKTSISC